MGLHMDNHQSFWQGKMETRKEYQMFFIINLHSHDSWQPRMDMVYTEPERMFMKPLNQNSIKCKKISQTFPRIFTLWDRLGATEYWKEKKICHLSFFIFNSLCLKIALGSLSPHNAIRCKHPPLPAAVSSNSFFSPFHHILPSPITSTFTLLIFANIWTGFTS